MKKKIIQILEYTITVKYHYLNNFFASIFLRIIIILILFTAFYLNASLKCQSPKILLNNVSINTVFEDDFKGVFLYFR